MSFDDLLFPFHEAEKPATEWRVGTEAEKFGMVLADGSPITFDGPRGVARVLDGLAERYGWKPYRERLDGEVIALSRSGASITLEPGAQLELSGAPLRTVHETRAEFDEHLAELTPISEALGIGWLGLGFRPLAPQSQLPWVRG